MKEADDFMARTREVVKQTLLKEKKPVMDWPFVRKQISTALEEFFYDETHRRPMVLPVIVEL